MARILLCLAASFCCLALPPPPPLVQGRPAAGLAAAGGGLGGRSRRLLHHLLPLPVPEPHFVPTEAAAAEERRRGVPVKKARSAWSTAAGSVRPELRAVPGGPDPLHHHGGSPSRRPEQDNRTPSP